MKRVLISMIIGLSLAACQTTPRYEGTALQLNPAIAQGELTINGMPVSP